MGVVAESTFEADLGTIRVPCEGLNVGSALAEGELGGGGPCETSGILNSAVNVVASIAATEALKMLVGAEERVRRTLLSWDVWFNERAEIAADAPRIGCQACGERDFVHLSGEGRPHITLCGRNSVQIHERHRPIDFGELQTRLEPHGTVRHNDFILKFCHEPYEMTLFPDGRAIIKGTTDTGVARSLYARYVGS